jgi:hypothetical protein
MHAKKETNGGTFFLKAKFAQLRRKMDINWISLE